MKIVVTDKFLKDVLQGLIDTRDYFDYIGNKTTKNNYSKLVNKVKKQLDKCVEKEVK